MVVSKRQVGQHFLVTGAGTGIGPGQSLDMNGGAWM